mmetsp:Transcript_49380/g.77161  ORF Transcript_49380/g.77161 Transcript_49380/m.77161 type:complete len:96 (+) Transcript_49380:252-539(+)
MLLEESSGDLSVLGEEDLFFQSGPVEGSEDASISLRAWTEESYGSEEDLLDFLEDSDEEEVVGSPGGAEGEDEAWIRSLGLGGPSSSGLPGDIRL